MNNETEIWKPVYGYEGYYEISSNGRVKSLRKRRKKSNRILVNKIKNKSEKRQGYYYVSLCVKGTNKSKCIHTMILEAFISLRPDGMVGRHKDGNSFNNVPYNLEWGTQRDNIMDRVKHGTNRHAFVNGFLPQAKINKEQALEIRELAKNKTMRVEDIAKKYGVCKASVYNIKNNKVWMGKTA